MRSTEKLYRIKKCLIFGGLNKNGYSKTNIQKLDAKIARIMSRISRGVIKN